MLDDLREKGYKEELISRIGKIDEEIGEAKGRWNSKEDILSLFFDSEEIGLKEDLVGRFLSKDVISKETGEVFFLAGEKLDNEKFEELESLNIKKVSVLSMPDDTSPLYLINSLKKDKTKDGKEAIQQIYRYLRGTDAPNLKIA